jgi:hypothetical protein
MKFGACCVLVLAAMMSPVQGQVKAKLAAVLAIEDRDNPVTQKLGVAVYRPFLDSAPYSRVTTVVGSEDPNRRMAEAIVALAKEHDWIDVFCSIHTTEREGAELARWIPLSARRKLRLVYSTACHSERAERKAWESLGARTVVTHLGINNPLFSFPIFLSRWIRGDTVEQAVKLGARETALAHRFALSLPGGQEFDREIVDGSVPKISGDPRLTLAHGWVKGGSAARSLASWWLSTNAPPDLLYDRSRGGTLGLALRAMSAEKFVIKGKEVRELLDRVAVPYPFTELDPEVFEKSYVETKVQTAPPKLLFGVIPVGPRFRVERRLVIELRKPVELPLSAPFSLRFAKRVWLSAGEIDPERERAQLYVSGVSLRSCGLSYTPTSLSISRHWLGGYNLGIGGRFLGIVPLGAGIPIGGRTPEAVPNRVERAAAVCRGVTDLLPVGD